MTEPSDRAHDLLCEDAVFQRMSQHDVQGGVQDYVVRALRVSLLRRGDPQSMAHVGTEMLPKKVHPRVLSVDSLPSCLTSSKCLVFIILTPTCAVNCHQLALLFCLERKLKGAVILTPACAVNCR